MLRRLLGFVGIVLGYSCYYLTRNSLTYTAPVMVADAALNMDITQVWHGVHALYAKGDSPPLSMSTMNMSTVYMSRSTTLQANASVTCRGRRGRLPTPSLPNPTCASACF